MLTCLLFSASLSLGQAGGALPQPQDSDSVLLPALSPACAAPLYAGAPAGSLVSFSPATAAVLGAPVAVGAAYDSKTADGTKEPEAAAPAAASAESKRRALPSPWESPPFPGSEYQGYPLFGVPPDTTRYLLMRSLQGTWFGDLLDSQRIRMYGWVTVEGNLSTCKNSNTPDSYWIRPNTMDMDQFIVRFERQLDSVQTDHIDWGFRSTYLFGIDYRYMTAGGWWPADTQLLKHNFLYGVDFTEQYVDVYIPWVTQGLIIRVGRWIACPDIETQFAPDNYMGSHSLLFTFDTYTQTGIMASFYLSKQWEFQIGLQSGTDMAPWYRGATPTGFLGLRWVALDNNNAFYTCLNNINDSNFRRINLDGQPAGHDNFNYLVSTWEHRFNPRIHTKTEAYFMWQHDAVLGGTPSIGNTKSFGGGGGIGADIPGFSLTYGAVNYTMFQLSPKGFLTVRNECWRDEEGERTGFPGLYSSHAVGITHNFTPWFQVRPEIGYYRNWTMPAFDLGNRFGMLMAGFDMTFRF
jgi:hypothetical protein